MGCLELPPLMMRRSLHGGGILQVYLSSLTTGTILSHAMVHDDPSSSFAAHHASSSFADSQLCSFPTANFGQADLFFVYFGFLFSFLLPDSWRMWRRLQGAKENLSPTPSWGEMTVKVREPALLVFQLPRPISVGPTSCLNALGF